MNWLHYLIEANLYLAVFYLAYCLLLNRNTHYQLSRAYLIFACVVSFVLPVLQIGELRPVKQLTNVSAPVYTDAPVINLQVRPQHALIKNSVQINSKPTPVVVERHISLQEVLWYTYLVGGAVLLLVLLVKLTALFRLAGKGQSVKDGRYRLIYLPGTGIAFSFFNYLFIGTDAFGADTVMTHELVHIRQKHSLDIVFLELVKIVNWFNPVVYLLQNSLKTIHEYIADEQTAATETDVLTYSSFLLNNAYGAPGPSITHSFFTYNLLKKRIIMLNQQRSGKLARLKYLVALPICAALLCTSTLVFSKTYGWLDLAPGKASAAEKYTSANHSVKRKHLKITQNGVTTITDQFAVKQNNKNTVITAATIANGDKILLKSQKISIEVIEDSTMITTKDGRPMLPVVNADGYYLLDRFLHKNINYTSTKGEKGGLVEIGFGLDANSHIINAKVVKSGGARLDALALNGFKAYKGVVNDAAGKNYKIGVYFFTNDYSIFKTDSLGNDPEFAGELIITDYKYQGALTSKGYEYEESYSGPSTGDYARVLIYEKNGDASWFYRNKCTAADLKMLKDKYGYTFPSGSSSIIGFIHPANVAGKYKLAYLYDVKSYLDEPYAGTFYKQMLDAVEYPKQAKKTGGVVVLNFNLGADGLINGIDVAKSAGADFDQAAVSALQSYKTAITDKPGKHSIAIVFCVAEKKYRPEVSESAKKDGYVGELAVAEIKSPFKFK